MSVYGGSYYGLLAFSLGDGVVHDASATVNATSSTSDVGWVVTIGGEATITATSSATCSGEAIIIERSDKFSYGSGLYSSNEYDATDLQTIVSSTSSVANVTALVYRQTAATITATSSIDILAGVTAYGVGVVTSVSTVSSGGVRYREASASIVSSSTVEVNGIATYSTGATITATSTVSVDAEEFFLESTEKFGFGSGLYGMNAFDLTNLQVIVSATSVSSTATAEKISLGTAVISGALNISANARRVPEGSALVNGASTTTVDTTGNGTRVRESSAISSTTATNSISSTRVREGDATPTATATINAFAVTVVASSATVTSACTTASICNRVRFGSGTPTASASITVLGFATRGGNATLIGTSASTSDSEKIFQGSATSQPEATITATCNRVQRTGGVISSTSGTLTVAREKWEVIPSTSTTWTTIAA